MVTNITGVNNIKCKVWRETICTQRKSIASPQGYLWTKTEQNQKTQQIRLARFLLQSLSNDEGDSNEKSKKKRFNTRNNFARVSHFSSPLLPKSVTNTKEFAFAYPTFLNNMARDDGRPLATSSLGQPFRRLKRLAPLAKRSTCSKSNRSRVTQKTSVFIGFWKAHLLMKYGYMNFIYWNCRIKKKTQRR